MIGFIVKLRRYSDAVVDQVLRDCGATDGGRRIAELGFFRAVAPEDRADTVEAALRAHPAVRPSGVGREGGIVLHGITAYQVTGPSARAEHYPVSGLTYAFHFPVDGSAGKRLAVYQRTSSPSNFAPQPEGFTAGTDYTVALNANQATNPGGTVTFLAPLNAAAGDVWLANFHYPGPPTANWSHARHGIDRAKKIPLADSSRRIGIADSGVVPHDGLPSIPSGARWHAGMRYQIGSRGTTGLWLPPDGARTQFIAPIPRYRPRTTDPYTIRAYVDGVETPCTIGDYVEGATTYAGYCLATFASPPPAGSVVILQGDEDHCDDFDRGNLIGSPHGSGCLSVTSSTGGDGIPCVGVAPEAPASFAAILTTRSGSGSVDVWESADAILLLAAGPEETLSSGRSGIGPCSVISCSWGVNPDPRANTAEQYDAQNALLAAAVDFAAERDVLVVAAAGNDGINGDTYKWPGTLPPNPAYHPSALCVGGICEHDGRMDLGNGGLTGRQYSRSGSRIDVTAAGRYYWTAADSWFWRGHDQPDRYWVFGGTSGATPHVAGVAWRMRAINPDLTAAQTKQIIKDTGDKSYRPADYDPFFPNAKILNAAKACAKAAALATPGAVWPHVQFYKPGSYALPTPLDGGSVDSYGTVSGLTAQAVDGPWAYTTPGGNTTLNGAVEIDLTAYSTEPITSVELWLGTTRLYSGPPATLTATASTAGTAKPLKIVAKTATATASETYSDVIVASLTSAAFDPIDMPEVDGAATAHAAAAGSLSREFRLSGSAAGHASGAAPNPANVRAVASASGDAEAQATLTIQPPLRGGAGGHAGAEGALSIREKASAYVLALEADDGATIAFGVRPWTLAADDGVGVGFGIAPSGYYGPDVELAGGAAGHAGATALPGVVQGLAGSASGHGSAGGKIPDQYTQGDAAGHAGGAGTITQEQPLTGSASGAAGATATGPQLPVGLSGAAAGQASAEGREGHVPLGGTAGGQAGAAAQLAQAQALSGQAQGHAAAQVGAGLSPFVGLEARSVVFGFCAVAPVYGIDAKPIIFGLQARNA